jgi:hypothetical protein
MTTNIQSFAGDVSIDNGNLSVKSLEVRDNMTKLASNNSSYSNVGILMTRKGGASNVAFMFTETGSNVVLGYTNNQGGNDDINILTDERANLVVYGNVYVSGSVHGDGSTLTGLVTTLQSVTNFGANTNQTVNLEHPTTGMNVFSNVVVAGNVTAATFIGDGSKLDNIASTLEEIIINGNVTSNVVEFRNATSMVTTGHVGIANLAPTSTLCVGANVVVDDEGYDTVMVRGNVNAYELHLQSISIGPSYGLAQVTDISNTTPDTISITNPTLSLITDSMAGIGIAPSAADVGVSGLHVDGHLRLGGEADNTNEELMYIKSAGALGVLANESGTDNTNTELRLQSGETYNSNITMVGKDSAQYMTFGTNAAERMRIDSSGRVGVGTASPTSNLHVVGNAYVTSNLTVGTANLHVDTTTGFVGVGTTSPTSKLEVYRGGISGTTDVAKFHVIEGGNRGYLIIRENNHTPANTSWEGYGTRIQKRVDVTDQSYIEFNPEGGPYATAFGKGGSEYMRINDGGNVGIGTTNPSSNLHVNGSVYVSSNLEVGTANLFVDTQTGNVGIGTTAPQAKLDTRGDAVFDTGKDDSTLTGLLNYSSTQSVIDAGLAQSSSTGSITASTDINPPPGVAGDVIAKYVNSHTTEIFTRQFSASSLSITTGDVIYFGLWVYATLDVSIGLFKFGETTQNNTFTATGNSRWTWYEKTITSSGTTSNPEFRIDNDSAGKTYYFTGYTIRKNPSQTTGLPFTPIYSPASGRGPVLSTQTLVARDVAFNGEAKISGLTYAIKSTGTLGSDKTEDWYRLLVGNNRDGSSAIRTKCKLQLIATGLHQTLTFDFNHMVSLSQTSGNSFNLLGNDHYVSRVGIIKLRLADIGSDQVALDMYIDHDVVPVDRDWTITLYTEGGSLISEASTFLEKITATPSTSIELSTDTSIFGIVGNQNSRSLTMSKNGNVGIGTTDPAYTLDVAGPINLTSNIVMNGEVFIKAHDATSNHVAIGPGAGQTSQGSNAVAVGYLAGQTSQHDNTVVLNASGSALNTTGTGRTYIKPLRVATVASNVMTYDQATGEVMDSGGLISNKLAIVSEQPPSALTGDSTVVDGHGRYKVTTSTTTAKPAYSVFSKTDSGLTTYVGLVNSYDANGDLASGNNNSLGSVNGEWIKLELPYKTTLRHFSLRQDTDTAYETQLQQFPKDFKIIGSNDDVSWTTLFSVTGVAYPTNASDPAKIFVVNASSTYKFYAIVIEKINSGAANGRPSIGEWRLFTETFTVDAGVVSTTAASGLDVGYTEHPVEPMTNPIHYAEGHGTYEADASTKSIWFHPTYGSPFDYVIGNNMWESSVNWSSSNVYNNTNWTTDVGGTRHYGEWLQLKIPYAITLAYTDVYPRTNHA